MEGLPRDILRLIVFSYLDGPGACALLQTCKCINRCVQDRERFRLRIREKDVQWHVRRRLEAVVCCTRCLKIFENKHRLRTHTEAKHLQIQDLDHCRRCAAMGTTRSLFPWKSVTEMKVECASCKKVFSTHKNEWLGRQMSCLKCEPLCDVCLKLKFQCEYCNEMVPSRHECPCQKSHLERISEWMSPPQEQNSQGRRIRYGNRNSKYVSK